MSLSSIYSFMADVLFCEPSLELPQLLFRSGVAVHHRTKLCRKTNTCDPFYSPIQFAQKILPIANATSATLPPFLTFNFNSRHEHNMFFYLIRSIKFQVLMALISPRNLSSPIPKVCSGSANRYNPTTRDFCVFNG